MMLASERHTSADLDCWREIERGFRAHIITPEKIERAAECIANFAEGGDCYLSCSWGKDSVAALHLSRVAGLDLPIVYVRFDDQHNPDCDRVRDIWLSQWPTAKYCEVNMTRSEAGNGKHWRKATELGGSRRITGMRGQESTRRKMMLWSHGIDRGKVCCPIAWWSAADVFAYMLQNDLPLHPAYGMLGGGRYQVDQVRVHSIGGETGAGHGRCEWEREYYSDALNRINHAQIC